LTVSFIVDRLGRVDAGIALGTDDQALILDLGLDLREDVFFCLYSQRFAACLLNREVANPLQLDFVKAAHGP